MEKNLLYAKMYRNKRKVNIMDDLKYWRSKDGSCPKCGCKERTETGSITSCGAFSEYDDLDKNRKQNILFVISVVIGIAHLSNTQNMD